MLSSNNYHIDQPPLEELNDHPPTNNGHCQQGNMKNTATGSPTVFLARVIVPQQPSQSTNIDPVDGDQDRTDHVSSLKGAKINDSSSNGNVPLLFVEQNDVISIEQQTDCDHEWFLAKSDQQLGRIPKSSCTILDGQVPLALCRYLIDNQYFNLSVCFASFVAQDVGDLSLTKGDIIVALVPINEHWMQGQVCFDSQVNRWPKLSPGKQVGTFPLNHCWQLDVERVKSFCYNRLEMKQRRSTYESSTTSSTLSQQIPGWSVAIAQLPANNNLVNKPFPTTALSSSLSSGSSSLYSADCTQHNNIQELKRRQFHDNDKFSQFDSNKTEVAVPPPRPPQLPRQISDRQKSSSERAVSKPSSLLTSKQQDRLKGWLQTVKKKTARLSTRITASLGLISLTRDEEFERHYESFKQLEKSIRVFIKNLTQFVEHFESFLVALQSTSDNLADFYRDKSHQKEINEMRKKNKALTCEHFHAFKRTIDRQVIAVASQLLQKFAGPHQLVHKRSAKLLDFDTKNKEVESCRDLEKKATLREDFAIAKDLYDRINGRLIEELPLFNQFALDIFRECILVLLESRRNLMLAYTQQTANLLDTPLMASYTASDVASTILMSCEFAPRLQAPPPPPSAAISSRIASECIQSCSDSRSVSNHDLRGSGAASEQGTQPSGSSSGGLELHGDLSRPQSAMSQFSSEFDQMALAAREISSTPLSQLSESAQNNRGPAYDGDDVSERNTNSVRFDEPDARNCYENVSDGSSDNKHNENIESTIEASRSASNKLCSTPVPRNQPSSGNENKARKRRTKYQVYVASWPFVATGPNQLSIACNQALKLIKGCDECGNSDWSLVKDKRGNLGYVPTSYIKKRE